MAQTLTQHSNQSHLLNRRESEAGGEERQRELFGGLNFGAAFFGWVVATGIEVLLIAILSAAGSAVALRTADTANLTGDTLRTVGLISGILLLTALAIAYFSGGYVAGRMSRFDGARQGVGAWAISIIAMIGLAIVGATLGTRYNIFDKLNLPALPFNLSNLTKGGVIVSLLALIITLLMAVAGGKVGENYHHKVDEAAE